MDSCVVAKKDIASSSSSSFSSTECIISPRATKPFSPRPSLVSFCSLLSPSPPVCFACLLRREGRRRRRRRSGGGGGTRHDDVGWRGGYIRPSPICRPVTRSRCALNSRLSCQSSTRLHQHYRVYINIRSGFPFSINESIINQDQH